MKSFLRTFVVAHFDGQFLLNLNTVVLNTFQGLGTYYMFIAIKYT
jgi:hypothetical protein